MRNKVVKSSVLMFALMMIMMLATSITTFAASAPTGLVQIDDTKESVKVQWNAVVEDGVYGYNVYYSTNPTSGFVKWDDSSKCTTTSTKDYITNLSAGSSFYVCVSTVTRTKQGYNYTYSEGPMSAPIEVVTSPNTSNTSLVQTSATTSSITMNYVGAIGANYYKALLDDVVIGESASSELTTAIALSPATTYYVDMYACRRSSTGYIAEGTKQHSSMKTLANKIGTNEFGITNVYDSINVYYFSASVNGGGATDGYEYQFANSKGKVKKTVDSGKNIRIENFINGTFYKYRVRTYVDCNGIKNYSEWSDYRYVGIPKKTTCKSSGKKIKLSWKKVSGASRYVVYISTKENSGYKKVSTLSSKKTNITITKYKKKSLKKGKTYYVKLVPQIKVGKKYKNTDVWLYWKCRIR